MDLTKPYKSIWFGDIHGPKPYKFIGFRWAFTSQTPVMTPKRLQLCFFELGIGRSRGASHRGPPPGPEGGPGTPNSVENIRFSTLYAL